MGLEVLRFDDPRWSSLVHRFQADIFYDRSYCRFLTDGSPHRPVMFFYQDDLGEVMDVTIEKEIASLAFFADVASSFSRPPVDLASPEYNSPIVMVEASAFPELLIRYRKEVDEYCRERGVVTEFVRMHPLSNSVSGLSAIFKLQQGAQMVYVDLREGYPPAFRAYRKGHKSAIKKAIRSGVTVEFCSQDDIATITALHRYYSDTMVEKEAKPVYLYSLDYFIQLASALQDRALLVRSMLNETITSASIFILGMRHVWFKYSGLNPAYRDTGAHTYAIDRTIDWASKNHFEQFMLGGGMQPGDSTYLSKVGFSHSIAPVHHFRKIHDETALATLVQAKNDYDRRQGKETRTDYFPSYWLT